MRQLLIGCIVVLGLVFMARTETQQPHREFTTTERRTGMFSLSLIEERPIVMLGDSLTAGAEWAEITGCPIVVNRGIPSDTTKSVLSRVDQITAMNPRAVFLTIGVNDTQIHPKQSISNIKAIVGRLSPAKVYLSKVFPVGKLASGLRPRIDALNKLIAYVPNVTVIDPGSHMAGPDGYLRPELTTKDIHLSPEGYRVWRNAILPLVRKHCR